MLNSLLLLTPGSVIKSVSIPEFAPGILSIFSAFKVVIPCASFVSFFITTSSNISFSDFKIGEKRIILLLLLKNSLEIDLKPTWLNLRVTFTSTGIRIS